MARREKKPVHYVQTAVEIRCGTIAKPDHMHHIFPVAYYPEIVDYYENIIALTPTQHLVYVHPDNKTQYVDRMYQYFCLVAKTDSIKGNLLDDKLPNIYSFEDMCYVLDIGLKTNNFKKVAYMDFPMVVRMIDNYYEANFTPTKKIAVSR